MYRGGSRYSSWNLREVDFSKSKVGEKKRAKLETMKYDRLKSLESETLRKILDRDTATRLPPLPAVFKHRWRGASTGSSKYFEANCGRSLDRVIKVVVATL